MPLEGIAPWTLVVLGTSSGSGVWFAKRGKARGVAAAAGAVGAGGAIGGAGKRLVGGSSSDSSNDCSEDAFGGIIAAGS
jgi:hypothetical protein